MNEYEEIKSMPKDEDVTTIPLGDRTINVVAITAENRSYLLKVALSMYTGEPCRICGALITMDDMNNGAVFAGYSSDSAARAAHGGCWKISPGRDGLPNADWAHQ